VYFRFDGIFIVFSVNSFTLKILLFKSSEF